MADSAPLVDTPLAPVPAGAEAEWFRGAGGAKLRAALFHPEGSARGSIVLSGGRTEPIEKYFETIEDFRSRGFVVLAHDWRGQGLSARALGDRLKGHAKGYNSFLDDFRALLGAYSDRLPKPWIAVGHSMGGCLTLLSLAHGEDRFAGAMLSAPMLGLRTADVPIGRVRMMTRMQVMFGRAARYVRGDAGKPFDTAFDTNALTHDRARFERNCALLAAEPDLALGNPTWGWLDFALRATAYLARPDRLRSVTIPVIILSAEEDALVDNAAQSAAARHLPQGKLISVPGAYHEILMERDEMRNIFLRAFDALTGRVAPKPASTAKPVGSTQAAPAAAAAASPPPLPAEAANTAFSAIPSTAIGATTMAKAATAKKPAAKKPAAAKAKPATAKKTVAKKPAVKKPVAKKPAAKPAAAKKTVAKKPAAAKKPAVKKTVAKKPAAKKPAAKKAPAKKTAAKKPAARKTVSKAKKAPAKKTVAKKPAAKKPASKAKKGPAMKKVAAKKPAAKKVAKKK